LLAEDNFVSQQVGLLMLSRLGYIADLAVDGLWAVNAVEKGQYDLILMDNKWLRWTESTRFASSERSWAPKCPCITVLTVEALEGDKQRFLDLGYDGYLSKPLQIDTLRDALTAVIQRPTRNGVGTLDRRHIVSGQSSAGFIF
jgi:CheY-like chemotaxis protein